jgi:hypothetical protein
MDTLEKMQSFKTNDNVTLKYFDTGAAEEGEDDKPWLILVRASRSVPSKRRCNFLFNGSCIT